MPPTLMAWAYIIYAELNGCLVQSRVGGLMVCCISDGLAVNLQRRSETLIDESGQPFR